MMRDEVMFIEALEELCKKAHRNSKDKGFWDEGENWVKVDNGGIVGDGHDSVLVKKRPINIGEKLMLMVSEIVEAFEAYRKGQGDAPCDKDCTIIDPKSEVAIRYLGDDGLDYENSGVRRLTNYEEEMADLIIRVADFCGWKGIDLGRVILAKMRYNAKRPHMHGKEC